LSPAELDAIHTAALPLDRRQQRAFIAACMAALDRYAEPGPGDVNRVIREHQRDYWSPPTGHGMPLARKTSSKLAAAPAIWAAK
jgi:hypothetical protein